MGKAGKNTLRMSVVSFWKDVEWGKGGKGGKGPTCVHGQISFPLLHDTPVFVCVVAFMCLNVFARAAEAHE